MNQPKYIFVAFALLLVLASCVPNKKILYLQKGDVNKNIAAKDTVVRKHEMVINEYKIQPLDMLNIQFETLSEDNNAFDFLDKLSPQGRGGGGGGQNVMALNGIFVNPDGFITYPVLGQIKVSGLTIFGAEKEIERVASQFVPDVVARVRMLNFRFTVLGEVVGEQVVVANNPRLTMMEAIGMAGGLTELADRKNVKLIRQKGNESEIVYINLLEEKFIESPYFYVQQNDVIIVPPLKQRPFRRYFVQNLGIISTTISFAALIITLANNN